MNILHKGYICYKKDTYFEDVFSIKKYCWNISELDLSHFIDDYKERTAFNKYLNNSDPPVTIKNQKIIEIIEKNFKTSLYINGKQLPIIYETITDKNNNIYGREIHSGLLFPIFVFTKENTEYNLMHTHFDENGNRGSARFVIKKNTTFDIPIIPKLETVIVDNGIASNNEVLEYMEQFNGTFKKSKKEKFIKNITSLFNENVYNEEIVENKPVIKERKKINKEVSIMENIEYLLQKLYSKNIDLYNKYNCEYQSIINEQNILTLNPLNIVSLTNLESKIEFALMNNKSDINDILDYIHKVKCEYLNNIINESLEKTSITLKEINKIVDLFLGIKDNYNLLDQRKFINDVAILYILEILENIDNVTIDELKNTYFEDYLKSFVININALINLNIITANLDVNLNQNLTCENVFNMIKSIKFINKNKDENIKKLILK